LWSWNAYSFQTSDFFLRNLAHVFMNYIQGYGYSSVFYPISFQVCFQNRIFFLYDVIEGSAFPSRITNCSSIVFFSHSQIFLRAILFLDFRCVHLVNFSFSATRSYINVYSLITSLHFCQYSCPTYSSEIS